MSQRTLVVVLALAIVTPGAAAYARKMSGPGESPAAFLKTVNTNGDRTISKEELDAYAKTRFAELENDNDKVLDQKELRGRLSAAGMKTADTDKDKTVDESEFVGYADQLFDMANKKGDKTLSLAELKTPAGRKLIRLLH